MDNITVEQIRSFVKRIEIRKQPKAYKMEIKNWPLFHKLREQGRMVQTPSGAWELKDEL